MIRDEYWDAAIQGLGIRKIDIPTTETSRTNRAEILWIKDGGGDVERWISLCRTIETDYRRLLDEWHLVISAIQRCDPIGASEHHTGELEKPWDVIERTRRERDLWRNFFVSPHVNSVVPEQVNAALIDAERYRWLRAQNRKRSDLVSINWNIGHDWISHEDLDVMVDRGIAALESP